MAQPFQPENPSRYASALRRIDDENSRDPNLELSEGVSHPRELLYSRRLTQWVERLCPQATEELRLAARCQHLCRWQVPRESYPMTKAGYLRWREDLRHYHAQKSGEILREAGYPDPFIGRVQALNLKQNFPRDPQSRVLEDALCLVFLQYQFGALAEKTSPEKLINALQKSWKKMTPQAQALALELSYPPNQKALLDRALA